MRIAGGLNASLRGDFLHALSKTGIDEMDLSRVTEIDDQGLALCRLAVLEYRVDIVDPSPSAQARLPAELLGLHEASKTQGKG